MVEFKRRLPPAVRNSPVDAFASLDSNEDGYTEPYPEFLVFTGRMVPPLTVAQAKAVFEAMDWDGDKRVSASEFFRAYTHGSYQARFAQ